jgi:hypothetical protein
MFNLITASGKWLANIPAMGLIAETISAYRLQDIRSGISYVNTLKPGIANETLKFFFNTKRLPEIFRAFNPAYEKIRCTAIKAGKILKPVVTSKRTSAALSALSTASTLLGGTSLSGFPIILCATGAAFATYYGEQRKASVTRVKAVLEVNIPRNYQQTNVVLQKHSYTFPYPTEIVKMGLDFSMSGIVCGASSYSFMFTGGRLAYNIYSEAKNYSKISKLKNSLEKKLTRLTPPDAARLGRLNPRQTTQGRINRSSGRGL